MNLANLTGTVSKAAQYLIIVLMVIYTVQSYTVFAQRNRTDREQIFLRQNVSMFVIHFLAYLIMYLNTAKFELILFYGAQVLYLMFTLLLYRNLYPRASRSLINNMCMLLSVGFIMITRLSYDQSVKQFEIAAAGTAIALLIPLIVRKLLVLTKMTWGYVFVGIGLLALVMIAANVTNGARLAIYIAGFSFQASEFVKIIDDHTLKMRVWERGSGETMACGTGACATVVAACENGFCRKGEDIRVILKGGDLIIRYTDEAVFMTGNCDKVFEGTMEV